MELCYMIQDYEFLSVYITVASRKEGEKISLALVEENLAACANILSPVLSIYRWEGKIERAEECAIVAKTAKTKFDALEKRVKELHSYECPCIVATPIVVGNAAYLAWMRGD
jgi:periplasmic divalent cation tolerance protein